MTSFRAPAYNPDTRKNPNSPVAHQPNVTYDHRSAGSPYGQPAQQPGYHSHRQPQGGYVPYAPPHHPYSNQAKSPSTSGPPHLTNAHHYAQSVPQGIQSNPNVLPPLPFSQSQGPVPRPVYSPTSGPHAPRPQSYAGSAPGSNILSAPTGTSRASMYANCHSSLPTQPPSSQADYLAYVTKYPYLKNAFLRRAKTYISPYSPNGGFTAEWAPQIPSATHGAPNTNPSVRPGVQLTPGVPMSYGGPPNIPVSRPTPQFQSPDAFRQDLNKAPRPLSGAPKWETMLKNLGNTAGGAPAPTNVSNSPLHTLAPAPNGRPTSVAPQPALAPTPVPRPSNDSQPPTKSTSLSVIDPALQSHTPPLPPRSTVARPIPTPPGESDKPDTPQRPEVSPISEDGDENSISGTTAYVDAGAFGGDLEVCSVALGISSGVPTSVGHFVSFTTGKSWSVGTN